MSEGEFTDADGTPVYVSARFHGELGRYLSFARIDESRRLETFAAHWAELSKQELSMLFSQATRTWSRKQYVPRTSRRHMATLNILVPKQGPPRIVSDDELASAGPVEHSGQYVGPVGTSIYARIHWARGKNDADRAAIDALLRTYRPG